MKKFILLGLTALLGYISCTPDRYEYQEMPMADMENVGQVKLCLNHFQLLADGKAEVEFTPMLTTKDSFQVADSRIDYSQIELRMLASLAHIKSLIDVFNKDIDIHTATASKIFNVPLDQVTPLMRRHAKAVNFGIIYGITVHGLSSDLQIPFSSAKQFIDSFNKSYPEIQKFQNETIEFAKKHGYVKTITNRIRYLDNINSTNFQLRSFSERAAVNTIIQGSAADLIKIAMINIDRMLTHNNFKTKLLIQIHDELIFLVPNNEKEVIDKIKYEMENALVKDVKFKVETTTGLTWYDLK